MHKTPATKEFAASYFTTEHVSYDKARELVFEDCGRLGLIQVVRPVFGPTFLCDEEAIVYGDRKFNPLASAAYGYRLKHDHPVMGIAVFLLGKEAEKGWTWDPDEG